MKVGSKDIKFRESVPVGRVNVIVNGAVVFPSSEYRISSEYAKRRYFLMDETMKDLYRDYKDDYDAI